MLADDGIGEWGFAALVEVDGYRLLFDTGAREETVLRNAEELKVDLASVTDVAAQPQPRGPHRRAAEAAARPSRAKNPARCRAPTWRPASSCPARSGGGRREDATRCRAARAPTRRRAAGSSSMREPSAGARRLAHGARRRAAIPSGTTRRASTVVTPARRRGGHGRPRTVARDRRQGRPGRAHRLRPRGHRQHPGAGPRAGARAPGAGGAWAGCTCSTPTSRRSRGQRTRCAGGRPAT